MFSLKFSLLCEAQSSSSEGLLHDKKTIRLFPNMCPLKNLQGQKPSLALHSRFVGKLLGIRGSYTFLYSAAVIVNPAPPSIRPSVRKGTPVRYSKAVQLVHEFSGALLCIDVQERAAIEGFAMKVVLKTVEPPSGDDKAG